MIATDRGKPAPLSSRFTLVLVVVIGESNDAAHFNRMQICLAAGGLECEKDYESVVVRFREELNSSTVALNLATMSDPSKSSADICYYLTGLHLKKFFL